MLYLSKGVLCKGSTQQEIHVARGNTIITLTEKTADIWLKGRFNMNCTSDKDKCAVINNLYDAGLAEYENEANELAQYQILTRCLCCPVKTGIFKSPLSKSEKKIMFWLDTAGIRLTTAELVYLMENNIKPDEELLYENHAHTLIETIYTKQTIFDNILEARMEHAKCRNEVVYMLLRLLAKKRIVML